ncbi:hypothetical protein GH714_035118 [Hevea brasiliensis]|uniref:DYW domain-containing protein n=1 Tax=Hevea brasiliensis TaxID=3981 RepID=A0A6A6MH25_HEVBR|nr:hypothetical protein GH714_035118 [Hevea brasiliensis]
MKEKALNLHSEKLAIAFGLIRLGPSQPIRIVKNLRVCGDCHSVAKLISMLYNRDIILKIDLCNKWQQDCITLNVNSTGSICFAFLPSPTFKKLHIDHLVSFRSIAKSHVASGAAEVSDMENAVAGIPKIQRSKTAHVKFQLQKECMFGDQFLLDVPIESTIQFKFILKQSNGDMFWQPGPDRIFKSWESKGTVIIAEDWENPEAQKITEELHQMEELMPNINNGLMFSGNIASAEDKLNVSSDFFTREGTTYPVEGHLNTSNESLKSEESVGDIKEDPMKKNNARALTVKNPMTVEDEENRFGYEDGRVLVPGLTPMQVVPRKKHSLGNWDP